MPTNRKGAFFSTVGDARLVFKGQIARLYLKGPWNKELVTHVHKALRKELMTRKRQPWTMLVLVERSALCTPAALDAIRESATIEKREGLRIATAWVVPAGVEGATLVADIVAKTYSGITPARVYETEQEAEQWLSAMLAMEQPSDSGVQPTLFARIGGTTGIKALVDDFYKRVLADPMLAPFFEAVGVDKLRRMQFELFSAALGGPVEYTGRPLAEAHKNLRIGLTDYQRFVRHLFDTLADYHVTEQERYEIVGRLNVFTEDVVNAGTGLVG